MNSALSEPVPPSLSTCWTEVAKGGAGKQLIGSREPFSSARFRDRLFALDLSQGSDQAIRE